MRDKGSVIMAYILAVLAMVLYVTAWVHLHDPVQSTYFIAHGCFLLLLALWAHVCS